MHTLEMLDTMGDGDPLERAHEVQGPPHRGIADGVDRRGDSRAGSHAHGGAHIRFGGDGHAVIS